MLATSTDVSVVGHKRLELTGDREGPQGAGMVKMKPWTAGLEFPGAMGGGGAPH